MRKIATGIAVPVLAMALGHMLSNAVRTLPAIAADQMVPDLGTSPAGLASMLGAFQLAFAAGQIPLGVALDRYGVKRTSLCLFIVVLAGIALAAMAEGASGFLLAQVVMGVGCCGMLLCPITYAAKRLAGPQFAMWPGLLLGVGNSGMVLSASPMAWLVDAAGWRMGFWSIGAFGLFALLLVLLLLRDDRPEPDQSRQGIGADLSQLLRLLRAPSLRAPLIVAFVSFAGMIGVRGLWGGPWLMEVRGLDRLAAGNVLLLLTLALSFGPALVGVLARRLGRFEALAELGHGLAGLVLLLMVLLALLAGAPPAMDAALLTLYGLLLSSQALLFVRTRAAVPPEEAGKALAAVNFSFFIGAAVMQMASGMAVSWGGIAAGLAFFGLALVAAALLARRHA